MPTYTTAVTATPAALAGAPEYTFHTTTRRAFLRERRTTNLTAVFTPIGTIFPNNVPVASTSTTPTPHDNPSGDEAAATCALDTAWSTPPTIAVTPSWPEAIALGPAQGQIAIETYPLDGQGRLTIPKTTFLVAWNFGAFQAGPLAVTIIYDE